MKKEYDYIIVGAGSAGCVLANRLSQNTENQVLLLEAGGKDSDIHIHVPAAFYKTFKTKSDWDYETIPQEFMAGREMYQPRGKVLGGSSSINAMIYIRGNRLDYDHWAALGNAGWSYKEVLPYFKKSENNQRLKDDFHGNEGELWISENRHQHPLTDKLLEAAQKAGFEWNDDFNGETQAGFGRYQVNIKNGKRWSTKKAFLDPAKNRKNLDIQTKTTVRRVLIEMGRATGVEIQKGRKKQKITAKKEVILCAGAFGSPQILMLSGIGRGEELMKHKIDVIQHLPGVGRNLQDHLAIGCVLKSNQPTLDREDKGYRLLTNFYKWGVQNKGPFTSNVAEIGGFIKSSPDEPAPDLQFHGAACYFVNHGLTPPPKGTAGIALGPVLLNPKSRGTVTLSSSNPLHKAIINPNYFSDEDDMRKSIIGTKVAQKICFSETMRPYHNWGYIPEKPLSDDELIKDLIHQFGETLYHPVGTCKMGNDAMAVVNDELQVHGIRGLRVADASIMPTLVRGNTNAPTIMIAEKAADLILEKPNIQLESGSFEEPLSLRT